MADDMEQQGAAGSSRKLQQKLTQTGLQQASWLAQCHQAGPGEQKFAPLSTARMRGKRQGVRWGQLATIPSAAAQRQRAIHE